MSVRDRNLTSLKTNTIINKRNLVTDKLGVASDSVFNGSISVDNMIENTPNNGIVLSNTLKTDQISENTPDNGVVIEGVLLKDNDITATNGNFTNINLPTFSPDSLNTDTINEKTLDNGVVIEGVLLKDNEITATTGTFSSLNLTSILLDTMNVDTIEEKTADNGVSVDGVILKDDEVTTNGINFTTSPTTKLDFYNEATAVVPGSAGSAFDGTIFTIEFYRVGKIVTGELRNAFSPTASNTGLGLFQLDASFSWVFPDGLTETFSFPYREGPGLGSLILKNGFGQINSTGLLTISASSDNANNEFQNDGTFYFVSNFRYSFTYTI